MSDFESSAAALGVPVQCLRGLLAHQIALSQASRNRHCPPPTKCQGSQAPVRGMNQRQVRTAGTSLLHVVFTLPARIAAIASEQGHVYISCSRLTRRQSPRLQQADPNRPAPSRLHVVAPHLGLGRDDPSPHVHMNRAGWWNRSTARCCIGLPSQTISFRLKRFCCRRLFRRLILEMLLAAHHAGRLQFFRNHATLAGKPRSTPDPSHRWHRTEVVRL